MAPPGGGRGGFNKGPQLPWLLQQQIGGKGAQTAGGARGASAGRGRGRGGASSKRKPTSRKEIRKAARQEKKHHRFEVQQQQAQRRHEQQQQQQQHVGSKRPMQTLEAAMASAAGAPIKKQKLAPEQQQQRKQQQRHSGPAPAAAAAAAAPRQQASAKLHCSSNPNRPSSRSGSGGGSIHSSKKTKFYDMLASDGVVTGTGTAAAAAGSGAGSQAAFLADLRLEREMARKLKVKKGKESGPKDGLDAFLSGITAGSSQLPAGMDAAAAAAAAKTLDDDLDHDDLSSDHDDDSDLSSDLDQDHDDLGLSAADHEDGPGFSDDPDHDDASDPGHDGDLGSSGSEDAGEDGEGLSSDDDDDDDGDGLMHMLQDSDSNQSRSQESESSDPRSHSREGDPESQESDSDDSAGNESESGSDQDQREQQQQQRGSLAAAAAASGAKYVPPHLRRQQQAAAVGAAAAGLSDAIQRRITGLLNRLAESNLQPICKDILALYASEGRRAVADAVSTGLLAAAAEGPRATEQFACVAAVFVAGLAAGARAQDISARFLEMLVARLEQAYAAGDGLACHNLIMLLAYCYSTGLVAADCMYSVLGELTRRFTESDVAMMLTLLNAVGLQLRSADPVAMKDFVLAVHNRAAAAGPGSMTKRAEIMLELVMDIKNNRTREVKAAKAAAAAAAAKKGAGGSGAAAAAAAAGRGGAAAVVQPGLLKWLKQSGIDDVTLANISWAKLVQQDKKGMWWHPAATDAAAGLLPGLLAEHTHNTAAAAAAADADNLEAGPDGSAAAGAAELLRLAAGMRMTTDARRAVFVAIMGSEDCAEASEKLLRLPLKGDQSREVIRVLVECCLQEARYNPYYGHLAARLTAVSKAHKVTLQYCIWDQWKEVSNTEPRRLVCLAGLVGHCCANYVLPLSALKPIDFDACATWTNKETFLWRHTMQQLLSRFKSDADSDSAFSRLAQQQALGALSKSLGLFLKLRVGPWLVAQADAGLLKQDVLDVCLRRLASAEKILLSSAAAVLAG